MERLFFYSTLPELLIEILRKQHGVWKKHLVRLVDAEGKPIELPKGCRFEHVDSGEGIDLLAHYLRKHARKESHIEG